MQLHMPCVFISPLDSFQFPWNLNEKAGAPYEWHAGYRPAPDSPVPGEIGASKAPARRTQYDVASLEKST